MTTITATTAPRTINKVLLDLVGGVGGIGANYCLWLLLLRVLLLETRIVGSRGLVVTETLVCGSRCDRKGRVGCSCVMLRNLRARR